MPPMCVNNGLKLNETEKEIKKQGLWLTELEGAMIARRIIFLQAKNHNDTLHSWITNSMFNQNWFPIKDLIYQNKLVLSHIIISTKN